MKAQAIMPRIACDEAVGQRRDCGVSEPAKISANAPRQHRSPLLLCVFLCPL